MGEKFNFLLLHLTPFNRTLPAVVEEICQTVIIANKTGSAKPHYCLRCIHCQRWWANGFIPLSDHTVLTHPFHHGLIQNTCLCWCRPFLLYRHDCGWHSNRFIWAQLEQGAGRGRRVVLERNKTKGRASPTGVGSRKVSAHELGAGKLRPCVKMWVIGTESSSEERAFVSFRSVIKPLSRGVTRWNSLFISKVKRELNQTCQQHVQAWSSNSGPSDFSDLLLYRRRSDQLQVRAIGLLNIKHRLC